MMRSVLCLLTAAALAGDAVAQPRSRPDPAALMAGPMLETHRLAQETAELTAVLAAHARTVRSQRQVFDLELQAFDASPSLPSFDCPDAAPDPAAARVRLQDWMSLTRQAPAVQAASPGRDAAAGASGPLQEAYRTLARQAAACRRGAPGSPAERAQDAALKVTEGLEGIAQTARLVRSGRERLAESRQRWKQPLVGEGWLPYVDALLSLVEGPAWRSTAAAPVLAFGPRAVRDAALAAAAAAQRAQLAADSRDYWALAARACLEGSCPGADRVEREREASAARLEQSVAELVAADGQVAERLESMASAERTQARFGLLRRAVQQQSQASLDADSRQLEDAADRAVVELSMLAASIRASMLAESSSWKLEEQSGRARALPGPARGPDSFVDAHAYQAVSAPGQEPAGFTTYTYVFFSAAPEREREATRRRYRALLDILQRRTTEFRYVAATDRRRMNLFCVPSSQAGRELGSELAYDAAVGEQFRLAARTPLLRHPQILRRMATAPGPFLVTVPARLADMEPDAPAVIADLSDAQPDAVADLVTSYLQGLLGEFAPRAAVWEPPWPQRVALWIVGIADATGALSERTIPPVRVAEAGR